MKYIKVTVLLAAFFAFTVSAFSADPTVTYAKVSGGQTSYSTMHQASWTATTGVDSVLILSSSGTPIAISDLPSTARPIGCHVESNSTADSTVSKIFVWFVSNVPNATTDISTTASTLAFKKDWYEAERDTVANKISPMATFDVDSYSGAWLCVLVYEPTEDDLAVAEVSRIYVPKREAEFK